VEQKLNGIIAHGSCKITPPGKQRYELTSFASSYRTATQVYAVAYSESDMSLNVRLLLNVTVNGMLVFPCPVVTDIFSQGPVDVPCIEIRDRGFVEAHIESSSKIGEPVEVRVWVFGSDRPPKPPLRYETRSYYK